MNKLLLWAEKKTESKFGLFIFALLTFIEPFFFMPVYTLFIIYAVARPKRSFFLAAIALIATTLGSIIAYYFGFYLWKAGLCKILYKFILPENLEKISLVYNKSALLTIFTSSFLPMPLKLITITAGFFRIPFFIFISALIAGRFLRYLILAAAFYFFGPKLKEIIDRYFYILIIMAIIIITLMFVISFQKL